MGSIISRICFLWIAILAVNMYAQVPAYVQESWNTQWTELTGIIRANPNKDGRATMFRLDTTGVELLPWNASFIKNNNSTFPVSEAYNIQAVLMSTDTDPLDIVLRRTQALLTDLTDLGAPNISAIAAQFNQLKGQAAAATGDARRTLYNQICAVRRKLAFSNPLLSSNDLLFIETGKTTDHMCAQYYARREGGGLYILKNYKTDAPTRVDLLQNATVQNGSLAGQKLTGGAFLRQDLSYDGSSILFACAKSGCYHIFKVNVDGSNLRQLTDGHAYLRQGVADVAWPDSSQNDFDPCWLPNGRIAFISERRGGNGRCHGGWTPTYALFSMKADGNDIYPLSYHETNEWNPSVNNDGMLIYTRWDYCDRGDCIAHHLWYCYPDGRDPRSNHGNYPNYDLTVPCCDADYGPRPEGEWNNRAIPNSPKYIGTAGPHHGQSFGSLVMIDPRIPDDGAMAQIKRITPDEGFPEVEVGRTAFDKYGTAWPLSENYYLCMAERNLYLLDCFGNREIIYKCVTGGTDNIFAAIHPIPLAARQKPPALTTATWQGERASLPDHKAAVISVMNVMNWDLPIPAGTTVKWMRIVQFFPQETPIKDTPPINFFSEATPRMSLGVVPVEADGSVYFLAPVEKLIYFQLLDDKGMAVHSMRSGTYVHPGEHLSCAGCHEDKWKAIPPANPLALRRAPSAMQPEAGMPFEPISFYRHVKPVLEAKCASCHGQGARVPLLGTYSSLKNYCFGYYGDFGTQQWPSTNGGGARTPPGLFGAHRSRMIRALSDANHAGKVSLTTDELRRMTLWLDNNSNELSAYHDLDKQRAGQLVWPRIDVDPAKPQGVEKDLAPPSRIERDSRMPAASPSRLLTIVRSGGHWSARISVPPHHGPQPVVLQVYSMRGELVHTIFAGSLNEGVHLIDLAEGLARQNHPATGNYIFHAQIGRSEDVRQFYM